MDPGSNSDKWSRKQLRQIDGQATQTNGQEAAQHKWTEQATQTNGLGKQLRHIDGQRSNSRQMARKQLRQIDGQATQTNGQEATQTN